MQPIRTRLTELLNIYTPILNAPMGYSWSADLACSVIGAGGFGFMGAAFDTPDSIRDALGRIRTRFGVPSGKVLPVGIGFIGWVLDKTEVSEDPRIPAALDELPKAIYFAFGEDLGKHVRQVRQYEAEREHKTLVFVCVSTVEEALKAVNEWEVDVIVAQGVEAGGHSSMHAPPLSILLSAVFEALPDGPPVVAAGGIATGAQVASLLTLGAAGVLLGTRLLFTEECQYTPFQKSAILDAGLDSSVHSGCFDEVMGFKWPPGIIGHAIKNDIYEDHLEGLSVEGRKRRYDEGKQNGDEGRIITWAGKAVGLTRDIRSATQVVQELHRGAVKALKNAGLLL